MSRPGDIYNIPNYLVARSLDELRRAMLQNNARFGAEFQYFDIQKDGNRWVAFFYQPLNTATRKALENDIT